MRTVEDALRSLKRYVAAVLDGTGDVYDVRMAREEPTSRPGAVVRPSAPAVLADGASHTLDIALPFEVMAYPPAGSSPAESAVIALQAMDVLQQGLAAGVGAGRARRVPLWDYTGVAWSGGLATDVQHVGFMRVDGISVHQRPDMDDDSLAVIIADMRLSWRREGDRQMNGQAPVSVTDPAPAPYPHSGQAVARITVRELGGLLRLQRSSGLATAHLTLTAGGG